MNTKTKQALLLPRFTETVLQAYMERDQARKQVEELTAALQKAVSINKKFHAVLKASQELVELCDSGEAR